MFPTRYFKSWKNFGVRFGTDSQLSNTNPAPRQATCNLAAREEFTFTQTPEHLPVTSAAESKATKFKACFVE